MRNDQILTNTVIELVELLKQPAEMAWESATKAMIMSGWLDLIPFLIFICLLLLYAIIIAITIYNTKDKYKDGMIEGSLLGLLIMIPIFWLLSLISMFGVRGVLKVLYPESMLIYQIIEKLFN